MSANKIKNYEEQLNELKLKVTDKCKLETANILTPRNVTEKELLENDNIKNEAISKILVRRAYCPDCKNELTTHLPAMYNPFSTEKQCIHKCSCGQMFNLEFAYPRIVFIDENGKEIFAHCE